MTLFVILVYVVLFIGGAWITRRYDLWVQNPDGAFALGFILGGAAFGIMISQIPWEDICKFAP